MPVFFAVRPLFCPLVLHIPAAREEKQAIFLWFSRFDVSLQKQIRLHSS
jgi:hypothetical protein